MIYSTVKLKSPKATAFRIRNKSKNDFRIPPFIVREILLLSLLFTPSPERGVGKNIPNKYTYENDTSVCWGARRQDLRYGVSNLRVMGPSHARPAESEGNNTESANLIKPLHSKKKEGGHKD